VVFSEEISEVDNTQESYGKMDSQHGYKDRPPEKKGRSARIENFISILETSRKEARNKMGKFETKDWDEIKDDVESIFMNKSNFGELLKSHHPDEVVDDLLEGIDDDVIVRVKLKDEIKFEIAKEFAHFELEGGSE